MSVTAPPRYPRPKGSRLWQREPGMLERAIELYEEGVPLAHIAKEVGVSDNSVRHWLQECGIHKPTRGKPSPKKPPSTQSAPSPTVLGLLSLLDPRDLRTLAVAISTGSWSPRADRVGRVKIDELLT